MSAPLIRRTDVAKDRIRIYTLEEFFLRELASLDDDELDLLDLDRPTTVARDLDPPAASLLRMPALEEPGRGPPVVGSGRELAPLASFEAHSQMGRVARLALSKLRRTPPRFVNFFRHTTGRGLPPESLLGTEGDEGSGRRGCRLCGWKATGGG